MMQSRNKNKLSADKNSNSTKKKETTTPIRISKQTKKILDNLVKKSNSKKFGRVIKADDLVLIGLKKISEDEISKLQDNSISNKDRMEIAFSKHKRSHQSITRDEFLGLVLKREISV